MLSLEECFCAQLDVARGSVIRSMEFGTETLLFPGSLPFMLAMFRRCYLQDCLIYCMVCCVGSFRSARTGVLGGVAQSVRACGSYPQCPGFKSLHRHLLFVSFLDP